MKKIIHNSFVILFITCFHLFSFGQFNSIIPENTATHTAVNNGDWSNPSTWGAGQGVPGLASIVVIPENISINYDVDSDAHVFAIRVDGEFIINSDNNASRKLVVDAFITNANSNLVIDGSTNNSGTIEILLRAFDIEAKKNGNVGGVNWNQNARNHYKDGDTVTDHFGDNLPSDGIGVLGRYSWDPTQATIALMTHGRVRIKGQDKLDFSEVTANIPRGTNSFTLREVPEGWEVGDEIYVVGVRNNRQSEYLTIRSINNRTITTTENTEFSHNGVNLGGTNYYTYVGNLTRNVEVHSAYTSTRGDITRRGHVMFMFNGDVKVEHSLFRDLGRTNKANVVDDLTMNNFRLTGSGNQTNVDFNIDNTFESDPSKIENQRGRYGLHFHKTLRGLNSQQLVIATGNVVWGSPGWGMVHHDSHADFTDNIVVDVEGGAMVAESGSETGIWRHNLTSGQRFGGRHFESGLTNAMRLRLRVRIDDDFKLSEGFCLQGRAVEMVDNVAGGLQVGYHYQGSGAQVVVADRLNGDIYEQNGLGNPFPYFETDRTAVPFIRFDNNIAFNVQDGYKSQNRSNNRTNSMNRVTSVISNLVVWNSRRFGIYMSTNFGYLTRDSKIHAADNVVRTHQAVLVQVDNDNLNFHNIDFYNFQTKGVVTQAPNGFSGSGNDAEFVFNNIRWFDSPSNFDPYEDDHRGHIIERNITRNPNFQVTFVNANNMDDEIDLENNDFNFNIRGTITDQIGRVPFGFDSPRQNPLTERVYVFANAREVRNQFLNGKSILTDNRGNYVEHIEYMSDRLSDAPTPVTIRIYVRGINNDPDTEVPTVSFEIPQDGDTFAQGVRIGATVNASDLEGGIDNVQLFLDGTLVRQESGAPYEWGASNSPTSDPVFDNLAIGNHTLEAIALDDEGDTNSTTITITVLDADAEEEEEETTTSVSFQNPQDGDTFNQGTRIGVTINASDTEQAIDNVQLFLDGTLVRQENAGPYEWGADNSPTSDPVFNNLPLGNHILEAIAFNSNGESTSTTITIVVCDAEVGGITIDTNATDSLGEDTTVVTGDTSAAVLAGDGIANSIVLSNDNQSTNFTYRHVVTDDSNNNIVLKIVDSNEIDFDTSELGTSYIWGWSFSSLDETSFIGQPLQALRDQNCSAVSNNFVEILSTDNLETLSVDDNQLAIDDLVIYPNPTTIGFINISLSGAISNGYSVKVYSVTGQIIMSETYTSQENRLQVSNLSNGMYFLEVTGNNSNVIAVKPFVKR